MKEFTDMADIRDGKGLKPINLTDDWAAGRLAGLRENCQEIEELQKELAKKETIKDRLYDQIEELTGELERMTERLKRYEKLKKGSVIRDGFGNYAVLRTMENTDGFIAVWEDGSAEELDEESDIYKSYVVTGDEIDLEKTPFEAVFRMLRYYGTRTED